MVKMEKIISYSQLMDHFEADNEDNEISDDRYKFRALIDHMPPLKPTDPNRKGLKYKIRIDWETGEKTYEPLSVLAAVDMKNNITKWADATRDEMDCIKEQEVFTKSQKTK